jgi:hypothetical protein
VDLALEGALFKEAGGEIREARVGGDEVVEAKPEAARRESLEGLDGGAVDVGSGAGIELA